MWIIVGQRPVVLSIGAGRVVLIFSLAYHSLLSVGDSLMKRWPDDLQINALFNIISVISGRWADYNERLCKMEPHLRLKRPGSNQEPLDQ